MPSPYRERTIGENIDLLGRTKGGESSDGRKIRGTIHWVSAPHALHAELRLDDRLFAVGCAGVQSHGHAARQLGETTPPISASPVGYRTLGLDVETLRRFAVSPEP
jgi:hypothetical protein